MPMMEMPLPPMQVAQVVIERPVAGEGRRSLPAATVLAQSAATAGGSTVKPDLILQNCEDVQTPDNPNGVLGGGLAPAASVRRYFNETQNQLIDVTAAKVTVLEPPKQGTIVGEWQSKKFSRAFSYEPRRGFLGTDQITFLVEVDGKRVKVVTKLYVVPVADDKGVKCFGQLKKIGNLWPVQSPNNQLASQFGVPYVRNLY